MLCSGYSDVLPLQVADEVSDLPGVTRVLANWSDMRLIVVVLLTEGETSSEEFQKKNVFCIKYYQLFRWLTVAEI